MKWQYKSELNNENDFLIRNITTTPLMSWFASLCNDTFLHDVPMVCIDGQMQSFKAILALVSINGGAKE